MIAFFQAGLMCPLQELMKLLCRSYRADLDMVIGFPDLETCDTATFGTRGMGRKQPFEFNAHQVPLISD